MRTLSIAALTLVLSPPVQTAGVSAIDDFVGPPITTANGCPANVEWDPEVIAKAVGLTLDEYFRMRDLRGLTPDDFCWMPRDKLVRAKVKTAKPKPDNPGAWAIFRAMQQSDEKGEVKADGLITAIQQRAALVAAPSTMVAGIRASDWTALGPGNIGGRIRAISIHPSNGNEIVIGGVSGGIHRSLDGGSTWTVVNDLMTNLAIASIARDPQNANTLYAGTGEGFFNVDAVRGYGVFRSTDGGASWTHVAGSTPSTSTASANYGMMFVNRVAVHPTNSNFLLAATGSNFCNRGGLLRSIDGGAKIGRAHV